VDTALGPTIRGRFGRVSGWYEVGPNGTRIELTVDPSSVAVGNPLWEGLLRPSEELPVRFRSTRVGEGGTGPVHVEGVLETAEKAEPVEFDAALSEAGDGHRLEAVVQVDREWFGPSADRFAFLLPATARVALHLAR